MPTPPFPIRARFLIAACVCASFAAPGCVERKLMLRSAPEGAIIRLDGEDLDARTPLEIAAPFDGVHRVELLAPGYVPLQTTATVPARWHDYFPLDVFAEFLWPGTIRETVIVDLKMERYPVPLSQKLTQAQLDDLSRRSSSIAMRADAARASGEAGPAPKGDVAPQTDDAPPPPPPPAPRKRDPDVPKMSDDDVPPPPPPPPPRRRTTK